MAQNTPVSVVPNNALVNNPKLEGVFSSIEKQLIAQTGFLKSMQGDFANQFQFNREMAKKTESASSRLSVADEDGATPATPNGLSDPTNDENKKDLTGDFGIGGLLASVMGGVGLAGLLGAALKKTVPALLAPVIGSFIKGAITKVLTGAGATEETAKVIGDTADTAVTWGIWGSLLFGKWGGVVGLLAGIGSHLGTIMDKNKDGILDGTTIGIDVEFWNKWGAGIGAAAGVILMLFSKKLSVKLLSIAATGVTAVLAKINPFAGGAPPVTTPPVTPPGTSPGTSPRPSPRPSGGTPPTPKPLPSGMRLNSAGKVIDSATGRFVSVAAVEEAMKNDPSRAAKYAKYAKFFKFAGPAMAVIPALIDPAMAIYNDESDEEIKKQIVGALGSIGGAYLGGLMGGAAVTMIPGVGQTGLPNLIGAAIGAVGGALSGEFIAEEVADFLMGGDKPEPVDGAVNAGPAPSQIGHAGQKARKNRRATRSQTPGATYNENGTMQASAEDIAFAKGNSARPTAGYTPAIIPGNAMSQKVDMIVTDSLVSKNGGGGGGVNLNQMGGNVSNNTNVGGASTTFNVFQASGSGALSNSLPVNMAT